MNEFILNEVNPVKSVKLKGKIVGKKKGEIVMSNRRHEIPGLLNQVPWAARSSLNRFVHAKSSIKAHVTVCQDKP